MERRDFFQSGFAAGLLGLGGTAVLPSVLSASPRRLADGSVRLSSNENPLGISPAARTAIVEGLDLANRYPGASKAPVVDALAAKHGVAPKNILMGNGSTEVNQMFVQLFARVRLVTAHPTYEDVGRYAAPFALPVTQVPLRADYSHDLDRMKEVVDRSSGPTMVYICNPNNPTATVTSSAEIDSWIASAPDNVYFLMDEAYYEYAEEDPSYWSALKWVPDNPNVIVVRTFSKIFGMAGMRLGYAVAHEDTIGRVGAIASYNNTNHFACVAALASLQDDALVERSVDVNARARSVLEDALDELDIERLPSRTNFLMHRIQGDLRSYIDRMKERGWLVGRPFPPMLSYNRVSFALPEDMARFAETLRDFRSHGYV
ncbi:MAG: aminotransferase class I/II-fold pyridoxal phosphate-dependent enzyme [Gemmatimonadetes bacterium]|nr:aminotransferase class I/II-fold pyridoxal phosphate-dependent enzyme [Gemmatimonadota bacterium]